MYISVCDDDEKEKKLLADYLRKIVKKRHLYAKVVEFGSGEELIHFLDEKPCAIYFLDIYMEKMNGVELAREILKRNSGVALVFTTTSPDFMAEGFELGVVHYLVKPFTVKETEVALNRCLRLVGKEERYIKLSVDREIRKILFSNIIYVEFQNRYCIIHTKDGEHKSYLRLVELEEMLDDSRFLRCHRSFLVNLDYVASMLGYQFILSDGFSIPVRREMRLAMKTRFEDYFFEKSRRDE